MYKKGFTLTEVTTYIVKNDNNLVIQNKSNSKTARSLTNKEGNKKRKELINLSTYPPINFKKAAFTLAEVLITLGIIGVVAALTIPTLIANTRSQQYRSTLKKTISTLSNAARMSQSLYGFDFAGIDTKCGANAQLENPENVHSVCSLLNGTLTAATHYANVTDIKINNNKNYSYIKGDFLSEGGREPDKFQAYVLSDGTIVAFAKMIGTYPCTLSVGNIQTDDATGELIGCTAFIDVNGISLPNKESYCSMGSNSLSQNTCVIKNKDMTDIFPVRFHDGIVEPATAAARYVLKTAK